ncbi:hypothetical protein KIH39_06960 [Telmatocola sphagniphila]|jgi:hypothetical protein|uniref:Uncharacterized protein n=1 Tax=Telmatocola sphagniphila TaxID=1123043 RepID=A0A8E6B850_9BACT|nr:DUF6559 family protein [Telmatocola sphagniphila]QVL33643.1 hypothetical protein KIH39_06960 [Telmatocola sphagniphila]
MKDLNLKVSAPEYCTTLLNDQKKAALRDYLKMAPSLRGSNGKKSPYGAEEVHLEVRRHGLSLEYITFAYAIYCTPEIFRQIHTVLGHSPSYIALRGVVASEFFQGDVHFDALSFTDTAEMGAAVFGTPADVNITGILGS